MVCTMLICHSSSFSVAGDPSLKAPQDLSSSLWNNWSFLRRSLSTLDFSSETLTLWVSWIWRHQAVLCWHPCAITRATFVRSLPFSKLQFPHL